VKNTWGSVNPTYKGVNTVWEAPSGEKFELQFHTQESFALKQGRLHELYEEDRQMSTTKERKGEIKQEMIRLSARLITPERIDKIGGRVRR
jgi:hypothetical protein